MNDKTLQVTPRAYACRIDDKYGGGDYLRSAPASDLGAWEPLYDQVAIAAKIAIAVAAERERCAKLCETLGPKFLRWWGSGSSYAAAQDCAAAIREILHVP